MSESPSERKRRLLKLSAQLKAREDMERGFVEDLLAQADLAKQHKDLATERYADILANVCEAKAVILEIGALMLRELAE